MKDFFIKFLILIINIVITILAIPTGIIVLFAILIAGVFIIVLFALLIAIWNLLKLIDKLKHLK